MVDPRRKIIDQAMEVRVEQMQEQIYVLQKNERLEKENKKLQKALARKELNLIKNL